MIYKKLRKLVLKELFPIYYEGDPTHEMFFIQEGTASFVIPQYDCFPYMQIDKGYYFGEVEIFL